MIRLRITTLIISLEIQNQDVRCKSEFLEHLALRGQISSCLRFHTCQHLVRSRGTRKCNRALGSSLPRSVLTSGEQDKAPVLFGEQLEKYKLIYCIKYLQSDLKALLFLSFIFFNFLLYLFFVSLRSHESISFISPFLCICPRPLQPPPPK